MAWIDFIMRILPSILLGFLIGLARKSPVIPQAYELTF